MPQVLMPARSNEDVRRFVYEAVRVLVDRPDDIVIEEYATTDAMRIQVKVHPSDFGKLIGQGGKNVNALRLLITAACSRLRIRYVLEVIDVPRPHS
jgi:predicted RNA-binding protein YlqC (UPF0109 family)